ncbi:MAG: HXXEE domain-containing protein [Anaerovoracaceae bacterium]
MKNGKKRNWYVYNWYKLVGYYFIGIAFFMLFWGTEHLSDIRCILVASLMALLAHQFEEYVFPAGGPVVINKGNFNERIRYRNYPGNMLSSMIVNNSAYFVYFLAVLFPQLLWLGIGTMFFNLFQLIGHGIKMNRAMGTWYNPGLGTAVFLLVPVSIYYFYFIVSRGLVSGADWAIGAPAFVIAVGITTILPVQLLKDEDSPYVVPEHQITCCDKVQEFARLKSRR